MRNYIDIRKSDIYRRFYDKNVNKCSIAVLVLTATPFVNPRKHFCNNDSGYQYVYEGGWDIELLKVTGNALNMSLDIATENKEISYKPSAIYVGCYAKLSYMKTALTKSSRISLTIHSARYAMCCKISKMESFLQNILCGLVD